MAASLSEIESGLNSFMHIFAHVHRKFKRVSAEMVGQPITLLVGVRNQDPSEKRKSAYHCPSPQNNILKFCSFFLCLQKHCDAS